MMILLGPKNCDAELALMHSFLNAAPDEESLEQSFWEPDRPVLCSKEFADEYSLMHYRTRGSRNGVRRYQDKNGNLTPEGYRHYAEMYGWGERPKTRLEAKAEKQQARTDQSAMKLDVARLKNDKAVVKSDRNGSDRNLARVAKTSAKLNRAQLAYDSDKVKTNKYITKAEQEAQKYFNEDGSLNDRAMAKYTYSNGTQSKMSLLGRLKFGNQFANAFNNRQLDQAKQRGDTDKAKVNAEFKQLSAEEDQNRLFNALELGQNNQSRMILDRMSSEEFKKASEKVFQKMDQLVKDGDDSAAERIGHMMEDVISRRLPDDVFGYEAPTSPLGLTAEKESKLADKLQARRKEIEKEIGFKATLFSSNDSKEARAQKEKQSEEEFRRLDEALLRDDKMRELKEEELKNHKVLLDGIIKTANLPDDKNTRDWLETLMTSPVSEDYGVLSGKKSAKERLAEYDKARNAVDDRVENNRFVEGSRAFKENADFMNKVDNFGKLNRDDRRSVEKEIIRRMDEDFSLSDAYWKRTADDLDAEHGVDAENEYDRLMDSLRNNFDRLSPQAKEYAAKAAINLSSGNSYSPGLADIGNSGGKVSWWIAERMDRLSGNMNGDQWQPGSNGEKARQILKKGWAESEARALEVAKNIGVDDERAWWDSTNKDFKKVQKALESDQIYQALKERDNLNGKALVKAVARDMGFPTTPEVLNALEWYVWRD